MRAQHRVLVTDGGERAALAIVRALGAAGHTVHVCSSRHRSLAGTSRYARSDSWLPNPLEDASRFAQDLAARCRHLSVDVLLPVSEASLLAVLENRQLFERILIPFASNDAFRQICDKGMVLSAARSIGIATPAQHVLERAEDARDLLDSGRLRFPIVVKPAKSVVTGATGREKVGVSYATDVSSLERCLRHYGPSAFPLLLQQRIVGPGIGVFILRWESETIAVFSHRRLREKPPSGGVSVYSESVAANHALVAHSEALLDHFGWRGVAMVEFKVDDSTGTPYLMEINGRFWGSLQLAITAGVDFPSLLIAIAAGEQPLSVADYRVGLRNRWLWGDVDHLIARLFRSAAESELPAGSPGRGRVRLDFLRWRSSDHNEVLRLNDPRPFFHETALWLLGR
jgi:predicted ATP-grasp superfamily ATP-dependent carboligase